MGDYLPFCLLAVPPAAGLCIAVGGRVLRRLRRKLSAPWRPLCERMSAFATERMLNVTGGEN